MIDLDALYEELRNPNSWHWWIDEKTGWFMHPHHHKVNTQALHVQKILDELDMKNPGEAERLRTFLISLYHTFKENEPDAANAIGILIGMGETPGREEWLERVFPAGELMEGSGNLTLTRLYESERVDARKRLKRILKRDWHLTHKAFARFEEKNRQVFGTILIDLEESGAVMKPSDVNTASLLLHKVPGEKLHYFCKPSRILSLKELEEIVNETKDMKDENIQKFMYLLKNMRRGNAQRDASPVARATELLRLVKIHRPAMSDAAFTHILILIEKRHTPTKDTLKKFVDKCANLPSIHFYITLTALRGLRKGEDILEAIDVLQRIIRLDGDISANILAYGLANADFRIEEMEELRLQANAFLDIVGDTQATRNFIRENIRGTSKERKIVRHSLGLKPNPERRVLLGGKLAGYIIRIMREESYLVWKHVADAGIPCEPILRIYKPLESGKRAIITRFAGENIRNYRGTAEERAEIRKQTLDIVRRLDEMGVRHGHPHPGNFVVEENDGKLIVRIIDFDEAGNPTGYEQDELTNEEYLLSDHTDFKQIYYN